MKIILLTSNELRHKYFRIKLASNNNINLVRTFCEFDENNLIEKITKKFPESTRSKHLIDRQKSEEEYFENFCEVTIDNSNPYLIKKGEVNNLNIVEYIKNESPDIILSYGCSIIKSDLIEYFNGRFINIHLGLSPYYRGSGTNFFPFVYNELQFVGATFMFLNEGIDTGEIIHQIRADLYRNDTIHDAGNRLISKMAEKSIKILLNFHKMNFSQTESFNKSIDRYFKTSDFTEEKLEIALNNIKEGNIKLYLENKEKIDEKFPILKNESIL